MPSVYWSIRERIRLIPVVARSIYIAQSFQKRFAGNEFSSQIREAARKVEACDGVALCIRIRDEALCLRELVEYYQASGIKHIFFYEARSADNFREVLKPFMEAGFVTLIDNWPHVPISPAAEHDCALRCIGKYSWMGCVDADEFVVIGDGRSIPEYLKGVPAKYPAIALHWRLFGSNGHVTRPDLPVTLAYSRRQANPNIHVKVFVRPDRLTLYRNSHSWYYRGLLSAAVNENNRKVWGSTATPPTAQIAWINHYYYKSLEEFQRKGKTKSIIDNVTMKFNSRTAERGAQYERTANEVLDLSAVDYHRGLCTIADCSICASYDRLQAQSPAGSHTPSPDTSVKPELTAAVVICTRFRAAELRNCLRKVAASNRPADELIIVDNSTGDKETERLAREYSARYIVESNVGLSRARNRGLSECKSDIVAYLDDDALPDADWLERIMDPFADSRVAVVTGAAIDPEEMNLDPQQLKLSTLDKSDSHWFEIAAFGGLGIGTNMALRKSACKPSALFDERLGRGAPFRGMEEHLAFAKLISQGYSAIFNPAAIVVHTSQNPLIAHHEARNHFAYSMLLYSEFPDRRKDLLGFIFRRMRRKPLSWFRNTPDPGIVISSSWPVLLKASFAGAMLYLKTRKQPR